MEPQTKTIADTLEERVNKLIQAVDQPVGWGHPLSSVTPQALAMEALVLRTQALEDALREIAAEVQKLLVAVEPNWAEPDTSGRATVWPDVPRG